MSMDVGGAKGGIKSDINVTPLVDVMLVLLIIMMIVAPLLQKGADVRLPLATNTADKPETQDQTVVAIDKNDRYFVNGLPVRKEDLRTKVEEILESKKERIILIKADEDARYAAIMDCMDELRAIGIEDMGLITDPAAPARTDGGQLNGSRPPPSRRRPRCHRQEARSQLRHEHHADDRRAARAPGHLHGRPAAVAARSRRQPAGGNQDAEQTQVDVSQIVLDYTADKLSINNQRRHHPRARGSAAPHFRRAQGQDDVHRRRGACATATSST